MMLDLEHMDDESLKRLHDIYERLGSQGEERQERKNLILFIRWQD